MRNSQPTESLTILVVDIQAFFSEKHFPATFVGSILLILACF